MRKIFALVLLGGIPALGSGVPPAVPQGKSEKALVPEGKAEKALAPSIQRAATEPERKLDQVLAGLAKAVSDSKGFTLKQESSWTFDSGGQKASGKNHFEAQVRADGKYRIRAWSDKHPEREFVVVSDGKTVTRVFADRKIHSVDESARPYHDLADDAFTTQALEGSFLSAFVRPDLANAMNDLIETVEQVVVNKSPDLISFNGQLENKRRFVLNVATKGSPTILGHATTHTMPVGGGKTAVMTVDTTYNWTFAAPPDDGRFAAKIPDGSAKVEDLMEAMIDGGSAGLLGKPAPELKLETLDGKAVNLSGDKGKPVMLYFYASWAAPSVDEMPGVNKFVESFTKKGAAMYAINVAEGVDVIKKLNEKNNYTGTIVRDPKGDAMGKLKLNLLPVSVLLGKDGTVQGIYKGTKQEVKIQLRKDLESLLEGKTLHK